MAHDVEQYCWDVDGEEAAENPASHDDIDPHPLAATVLSDHHVCIADKILHQVSRPKIGETFRFQAAE